MSRASERLCMHGEELQHKTCPIKLVVPHVFRVVLCSVLTLDLEL